MRRLLRIRLLITSVTVCKTPVAVKLQPMVAMVSVTIHGMQCCDGGNGCSVMTFMQQHAGGCYHQNRALLRSTLLQQTDYKQYSHSIEKVVHGFLPVLSWHRGQQEEAHNQCTAVFLKLSTVQCMHACAQPTTRHVNCN